MSQEDGYLGFFRYEGRSVAQGYLDARKSAEALLGVDEAIRFFVGKQTPNLRDAEYELPVRIRKGSWEALIPHDLPSWIQTVLGVAATAYMAKAGQKLAENDIGETGLRDVFKRSLKAIQWVIRIGKHLGSLTRRTFEHVEWRAGNTEIGIPNEAGNILFVPTTYFELYNQIPATLLARLTSVVAEDRELLIGVREDNQDDVVSVDFDNKNIFCPSNEEEILPELTHGLAVELEGLVTRGNENSNTIGFQYNGHILTCYPKDGSIVRFKPGLFLRCTIIGTITRADRLGRPTELRPKIVFSNLVPLGGESDNSVQQGLFDDET